jgi:hypothetical protein
MKHPEPRQPVAGVPLATSREVNRSLFRQGPAHWQTGTLGCHSAGDKSFQLSEHCQGPARRRAGLLGR